jgi:hypothetical protein
MLGKKITFELGLRDNGSLVLAILIFFLEKRVNCKSGLRLWCFQVPNNKLPFARVVARSTCFYLESLSGFASGGRPRVCTNVPSGHAISQLCVEFNLVPRELLDTKQAGREPNLWSIHEWRLAPFPAAPTIYNPTSLAFLGEIDRTMVNNEGDKR